MAVTTRAANVAWMVAGLPGWRRFRRALADPRREQLGILAACLRQNKTSVAGRERRFDAILARRSPEAMLEAFQAAVPLTGADDLQASVDRIRRGERGVLTTDPVLRLMPTSGSTRPAKLVPYTAALQREFAAAIDPWIADTQLRTRTVLGGPSYWSISPAVPHDRSGPVPIGFDDDAEYLGWAQRRLSATTLVMPRAITRVTDPDAFRYLTLVFLARRRDLRLISIWHPSYLTGLLDVLPEWLPAIARDIALGTLSPPGALAGEVHARLLAALHADPARARELGSLPTLEPAAIWPALALVSAWRDGHARLAAGALDAITPGVGRQAKGLVATEGIVSIPFAGRHPAAIRSHFLEFVDDSGQPRLADELTTGAEYSIVLTTGGGLYRYRLGDRVRVDGWVERTPSIRFAGREDRVSDRAGEKLSEGFVATVIERLFAGTAAPRFAMLAPEVEAGETGYTLYVSAPVAADLRDRLDLELRRNPHYAWCVDLRQLRPARVARVGATAERAYLDACVARGQRMGEVKPAALHADTGWSRIFGVDEGAAARAC